MSHLDDLPLTTRFSDGMVSFQTISPRIKTVKCAITTFGIASAWNGMVRKQLPTGCAALAACWCISYIGKVIKLDRPDAAASVASK